MKEKSYHVRQRSSQNTTLQVVVPPRPQSPTHPFLTRTRKAFLVVKQICLYLISSDKVSSERCLSPSYLSSVRFLQQSLPVPKQRKKSLEGFPLHVNCILNGPAEIVYFISSRPTSYNQYQFLSADMNGKNHPRPGWFELRHAFSSFFFADHT